MIKATTEKVAVFKKLDGSYSFMRNYSSHMSQGMPVAVQNTVEGDVNYPLQMAAVAIVSFPLFLVFIFLRKYIMKGVSRSGIKG